MATYLCEEYIEKLETTYEARYWPDGVSGHQL